MKNNYGITTRHIGIGLFCFEISLYITGKSLTSKEIGLTYSDRVLNENRLGRLTNAQVECFADTSYFNIRINAGLIEGLATKEELSRRLTKLNRHYLFSSDYVRQHYREQDD